MQSNQAQQHPSKRTEDLCIEKVYGETLVYDEASQQAHCLNPIASAIWSACDGCSSIADIAHTASRALNVTVSADAVLLALEDFRRNNLLQPSAPASAETPAVPTPLLSRRAMAFKLGTAAAMALPIISTIAAPKAAQAYNGCADC